MSLPPLTTDSPPRLSAYVPEVKFTEIGYSVLLFESFRSFERVRKFLLLENLILDVFEQLNSHYEPRFPQPVPGELHDRKFKIATLSLITPYNWIPNSSPQRTGNMCMASESCSRKRMKLSHRSRFRCCFCTRCHTAGTVFLYEHLVLREWYLAWAL